MEKFLKIISVIFFIIGGTGLFVFALLSVWNVIDDELCKKCFLTSGLLVCAAMLLNYFKKS